MSDDSASDLDLGKTVRHFRAGQAVFARYRLVRVLGRGGMGVVWLAQDETLEREVALKFLPELVTQDRVAVADLKRETNRSLQLTHPHIVRVHDFVEDRPRDLVAISMEYVDGDNLSNLRAEREHRCFEVEELGEHVRSLCEALEYAHQKARIIHRDLKPANLMLTSGGELKVADFGIARSLVDSVSRTTGGMSGTLVYMSPQQAIGKGATALDDIYSLGATLYDLLTGKPPFYTGNIVRQVETVVPSPMSERRAELGVHGQPISATWEKVIAACLEKDPARRPQGAMDVAWRLGLVKDYVPKAVPVTSTPAVVSAPHSAITEGLKRRRPQLLATAAVLILGSAAWAGWWFGVAQPRREAESQQQLAGQRETTQREQERLAADRRAKADADAEKERLAAAERIKEEEARKKGDSLKAIATATKAKPYENSLGMRFVPVPITGGSTTGQPVLFSVWETRVRDFAQFIDESGRDMEKGDAANTLEPSGKGSHIWKPAGGDWRDPHFPAEAKQTEEHPVVCVSWDDAVAFSEWLTEREHKAARLPTDWSYRLPSDHEWSCAVGIGEQENASQTPQEKSGQTRKVYPWGKTWPPPRGAGNYSGEESRIGVASGKSWSVLKGYRDGAPRTSEAGQYEANEHGVYDLGGNVWEWCSDKYKPGETRRVLRGASWANGESEDGLLASFRASNTPTNRHDIYGFRLVLVVKSSDTTTITATQRAKEEEKKANSREAVAAASKEQPYVNSLAMKFVPVLGTGVLFSTWETRVRDFQAFVDATGYNAEEGMFSLENGEIKQVGRTWKSPGFEQTGEHAVCGVSYEDATAFCEWLTKEERKAGRISAKQKYRLPIDLEWSAAVGLKRESGSTPGERAREGHTKLQGVYPWGTIWPPPAGAGNYAGSEALTGGWPSNSRTIERYRDDYPRTSPVGSFAPNGSGIYDLGGNVWEWCQDWINDTKIHRVLRGAAWISGASPDDLLSSHRSGSMRGRISGYGFRCVLVIEFSR